MLWNPWERTALVPCSRASRTGHLQFGVSFHIWWDDMVLCSHECFVLLGQERRFLCFLPHTRKTSLIFQWFSIVDVLNIWIHLLQKEVFAYTKVFACSFSLHHSPLLDPLLCSHGYSIQLDIWKPGSVGHSLPCRISGCTSVLWSLVLLKGWQHTPLPLCVL